MEWKKKELSLILNKIRETRGVGSWKGENLIGRTRRVLQKNPFRSYRGKGRLKKGKNPGEKKGSLDLCSS
jgi:hypothetical protein